MRNWEMCLNSVSTKEVKGLARVFSVDVGYLQDIGGLCRVVIFGWGIELYGKAPQNSLR